MFDARSQATLQPNAIADNAQRLNPSSIADHRLSDCWIKYLRLLIIPRAGLLEDGVSRAEYQ